LAKFVGTPPVVEQDSGKKREVAEVQSEEEFNADAKGTPVLCLTENKY